MIPALLFTDLRRLVHMAARHDKRGFPFCSASAPTCASWRSQTQTLDRLGAFGPATGTLTGGGDPEPAAGESISPSLVSLPGWQAAAGRACREGADAAGGEPAAMISEALWKQRLVGKRAVINGPLIVNGTAVTLPPA